MKRLPAVILILAAINITVGYFRLQPLVYITKPLTTLLIILLASQGPAIGRRYRSLILIGLFFSLIGDVCLMLPARPRSYFLPGLVSFMIAHLFYIAAFSWKVRWTPAQLPRLIPFALAGMALDIYLWPHLGATKLPVVCYTAVIATMAWRASCRIGAPQIAQAGAVLATIGAVLFMISDSTLAINRFACPFAASRLVILSTYFVAQTLIALSVRR